MATTGQEALEVLRAGADVRLVLLDVTMPGMPTEEVVATATATHPDLTILLMSGYTESELAPLLAAAGVSGFLHKPFSIHAVADGIRSVLERSPEVA